MYVLGHISSVGSTSSDAEVFFMLFKGSVNLYSDETQYQDEPTNWLY